MLSQTLKFYLQKHPDRQLQTAWNCAQLGVLILPLIPILGALGVFIGLVETGRHKFHSIRHRPLNQGFALLSLLLVLVAGVAQNRLEAFLGLGNFFPFFILFVTYSTLIQTPGQLYHLAWLLILGAIPVLFLGFGQQFLGLGSPVWLQSLVGWILEPKGNPPGRMASVFMYANILACYLTIIFILGLGLLIITWQQQKAQPKNLKSINLKQKILTPQFQFRCLLLVIISDLIALIFTNSRNAWGLTLLALLAFAFYLGWRILVVAVMSVASSILLSAFGPEPLKQGFRILVPAFFWKRLTDELYPNRSLASLRTTQWQFAWTMTQQRPLTGWGLRNFTPLYEAQMNKWLGHPHSLFLMLTAETGIPATLFFCGLVGWILAQTGLLLIQFSTKNQPKSERVNSFNAEPLNSQEHLILFSYFIAFLACTLFNTVDVTLFDLRVNALGWLLLAAVAGVTTHLKTSKTKDL